MTKLRTSTSRSAWAWLVAVFLVWFGHAAPADARGWQSDTSAVIETIRTAVPDADLIVVLDDGKSQRRSAPGRALTGMLVEFGLAQQQGEFAKAWSQFAGMFGLDNGRAFDELFGQRMILVAENTTTLGFGSWSIATVVPTPLALEIIKKLGAKGRDSEAYQTVYAIEGGAYRVSLLKPSNASGPDEYRLIVFSPRDSNELLRKLIRGLVSPMGWSRVVGKGNLTKPTVTGVLFTDQAEVARINAALTDDGWDGLGSFEMPEFEMRSSGWTGPEFEALAQDAWLALADEVDLALLADSPVASILPIDPERLRQLSAHCTGRVFLRIAPEDEEGAAIAICLEMDGTPEAAALADRAVRDVVGLLTAKPDGVPDYRGFLPEAVRTAPVRSDFAYDVLRPAIGRAPAVAWRTASKGNTSWWTTRIAPGNTAHTEKLDELLAGLPGGETGGPLVSLGMAHPGPLTRLVELGTGAPEEFHKTLGRVETLEWSTRQRGTLLEVSFGVRMSPSE